VPPEMLVVLIGIAATVATIIVMDQAAQRRGDSQADTIKRSGPVAIVLMAVTFGLSGLVFVVLYGNIDAVARLFLIVIAAMTVSTLIGWFVFKRFGARSGEGTNSSADN